MKTALRNLQLQNKDCKTDKRGKAKFRAKALDI